jgi:hypothetical protein
MRFFKKKIGEKKEHWGFPGGLKTQINTKFDQIGVFFKSIAFQTNQSKYTLVP